MHKYRYQKYITTLAQFWVYENAFLKKINTGIEKKAVMDYDEKEKR